MTDSNHWDLRDNLFSVLEADSKLNYERIQSDPTDLNRRNYVRSLFALYEVVFSNLRETIANRIISKNFNKGNFDLFEVYPLMDETPFINEQGKVSRKPNQLAFKSIVKYVLKLACQEYQIKENVFDNGWNDFIDSIQIRHRITHPKYENEITVSDQDLEVIERGRIWLNTTMKKIRTEGVL